MFGLLLQVLQLRLQRHRIGPRTFLVLQRDERLGEISFSAYEAQYGGRGWRVTGPQNLALERYRFWWQAVLKLLREERANGH